jgi:hypothetical protein
MRRLGCICGPQRRRRKDQQRKRQSLHGGVKEVEALQQSLGQKVAVPFAPS